MKTIKFFLPWHGRGIERLDQSLAVCSISMRCEKQYTNQCARALLDSQNTHCRKIRYADTWPVRARAGQGSPTLATRDICLRQGMRCADEIV